MIVGRLQRHGGTPPKGWELVKLTYAGGTGWDYQYCYRVAGTNQEAQLGTSERALQLLPLAPQRLWNGKLLTSYRVSMPRHPLPQCSSTRRVLWVASRPPANWCDVIMLTTERPIGWLEHHDVVPIDALTPLVSKVFDVVEDNVDFRLWEAIPADVGHREDTK